MNKKQVVLTFLPVIGAMIYIFTIFIQSVSTKNNSRWLRAGGAFFVGMLSFIVIYGGFTLISNLTNLNLESNLWLVYLMLYLSLTVWNVVFFLSYNRFTKVTSVKA